MSFTFEDKVEVRQIVHEEMKEVSDKVSFLPTKDEFFTEMDKLYGELVKRDQEDLFYKNQVRRNTDKIETLEKRIKILQKPALS